MSKTLEKLITFGQIIWPQEVKQNIIWAILFSIIFCNCISSLKNEIKIDKKDEGWVWQMNWTLQFV